MEPNQQPYPLDGNLAPQDVQNPLGVMQPGERVVCEIRRHPIGLFGLYAVTALVLGIIIGAAILVPMYLTFLTDTQKVGIVLCAGLLAILTLLFAYISAFIYQANRWIVTTDSVTQITQNSLFDRHSSQLSLANLEDTSSEQHNLIQELFGYGDITLETAGAEPGKFVFDYCPTPDKYARMIIAAHEEFMQRAGGEAGIAHHSLAVPAGSFPRPVDDQQQPPQAPQPPQPPASSWPPAA